MNEFLPSGGNERYEACSDEDGGLIGGASLKPADFMSLMNTESQEQLKMRN